MDKIEHIDAKKAAEISQLNAERLSESQMRSVMQEIRSAIAGGERSIKYFSSINNETLKKLKDLGYYILDKTDDGPRQEYYKIISW